MKTSVKPLLSLLFLMVLVGCATGSSPPSSIERALYHVTTNYHTNVVPVAVISSNSVVTATNYVTNVFATYGLEEKEAVTSTIGVGGQVATGFGFGGGGIIASLILGALAAWAQWKNSKNKKLAKANSQGLETGRYVIAATAGPAVEAKFVESVKSIQVEAGVKNMATKISSEDVNNLKAKEAAEKVLEPTLTPT
jgi:hypothetical protein